jgi:hypothetical protein
MSTDKEFNMRRLPVPNTRVLQSSIITETEGMPQHIEFTKRSTSPSRGWLQNLRVALPMAAFCIIALVMVISSDTWIDAEPELNNVLVNNDNLDWQEIMLLEDEWLLAEL